MKESMKAQANKFVNSENDVIRIKGFKREFKLMLSKVVAPSKTQSTESDESKADQKNQEPLLQEAEPKEHSLGFE